MTGPESSTVQLCRTVAEVRRHVVVDEFADLSWLDQSDAEMGEGFELHARERRAAFDRGDLWMVGVFVTLHDGQGREVARSAGLWGIESDSGDDYFDESWKPSTASTCRGAR